MTTEEKIKVMQHYVDGGAIQVKDIDGFRDIDEGEGIDWNWYGWEYRIKPEPEYKPWTAETIPFPLAVRKKSWSKDECTFSLRIFVSEVLEYPDENNEVVIGLKKKIKNAIIEASKKEVVG